jgi:anaerobic selenocysteine-containing dehydrogenase
MNSPTPESESLPPTSVSGDAARPSRRDFLKTSAIAGAAVTLGEFSLRPLGAAETAARTALPAGPAPTTITSHCAGRSEGDRLMSPLGAKVKVGSTEKSARARSGGQTIRPHKDGRTRFDTPA